jgi:uncharacterized protein (DUF342 family)
LDSYDTEDIANEDEQVNSLATELSAMVEKSDKKQQSKPPQEDSKAAQEETVQADDSTKQEKAEAKTMLPPAFGATRSLTRRRVG